jgi:excisionase family DNA binding protein
MIAVQTTQLETRTASTEPRMQLKLMYTKAEAAEMLSLSLRTIDNLIGNKELVVRRTGKRVLIPYQSLMQFTRHDHKTGRVQ